MWYNISIKNKAELVYAVKTGYRETQSPRIETVTANTRARVISAKIVPTFQIDQKLQQNKSHYEAHLAGLHRICRRYPPHTVRQGIKFHPRADDRTGICRCERETRHEIYKAERLGKGQVAGTYDLFVHELEKVDKRQRKIGVDKL